MSRAREGCVGLLLFRQVYAKVVLFCLVVADDVDVDFFFWFFLLLFERPKRKPMSVKKEQ